MVDIFEEVKVFLALKKKNFFGCGEQKKMRFRVGGVATSNGHLPTLLGLSAYEANRDTRVEDHDGR